jgi:hypothetical protein
MRFTSSVRIAAAAAVVSLTAVSQAFVVSGRSWPAGGVVLHLQLGTPPTALSDGETSWGAVAEAALADWNREISRTQFTVIRDSIAPKAQGNRINNVFFHPDVYGEGFGENVLAVTITYRNSRAISETDVIFNSNRVWDSYRGPMRRGAVDFRRVALHEFGHALGLDHPDEATPAQSVAAVMNSRISNTEFLQPDDIDGARSLYSAPAVVAAGTLPVIVSQPAGTTVQVTGSHTLSVAATGAGPFSYSWRFRAATSSISEPLPLAMGPSYTIGSVQPADAGTYSVLVSNSVGAITSSTATLDVLPVTTHAATTVANVSTRGVVGSGENLLIAGFVIAGSTPKPVVVRAVGPALVDFGVSGALLDPELRVLDSSGRVVAQNDSWASGGDAAAVATAFSRLGAFSFRSASRDAALVLTLPPGSYTAQVGSVGGSTGVALVEVYDADLDAATARSRPLINLATRGHVGTGEDVLIAGLVVSGPGPRTYLIRAAGPTLAGMGVAGALDDPFLQIYKGETLLRENDDWESPQSAQPALRDAASRVGAFPLQVRRDAAMIITLQPGTYTAKVSGYRGTTGVALVEMYELE